jgi:hypothetical protein
VDILLRRDASASASTTQTIIAVKEENNDHNWEKLCGILSDRLGITPKEATEHRDIFVEYIRSVSRTPSKPAVPACKTVEPPDGLGTDRSKVDFIKEIESGLDKGKRHQQLAYESEEDNDEDDTDETEDEGYDSEKIPNIFDSPRKLSGVDSKPSSMSPTIASCESDSKSVPVKSAAHLSERKEATRGPKGTKEKRSFSSRFRNFGQSAIVEQGPGVGSGPVLPSPPPQSPKSPTGNLQLPRRASTNDSNTSGRRKGSVNSFQVGFKDLRRRTASWASDAPTLSQGFG